MEYGIFNDESATWHSDEAVESGFYSMEEATAALKLRYSDEDELVVHKIENDEDESEDES